MRIALKIDGLSPAKTQPQRRLQENKFISRLTWIIQQELMHFEGHQNPSVEVMSGDTSGGVGVEHVSEDVVELELHSSFCEDLTGLPSHHICSADRDHAVATANDDANGSINSHKNDDVNGSGGASEQSSWDSGFSYVQYERHIDRVLPLSEDVFLLSVRKCFNCGRPDCNVSTCPFERDRNRIVVNRDLLQELKDLMGRNTNEYTRYFDREAQNRIITEQWEVEMREMAMNGQRGVPSTLAIFHEPCSALQEQEIESIFGSKSAKRSSSSGLHGATVTATQYPSDNDNVTHTTMPQPVYQQHHIPQYHHYQQQFQSPYTIPNASAHTTHSPAQWSSYHHLPPGSHYPSSSPYSSPSQQHAMYSQYYQYYYQNAYPQMYGNDTNGGQWSPYSATLAQQQQHNLTQLPTPLPPTSASASDSPPVPAPVPVQPLPIAPASAVTPTPEPPQLPPPPPPPPLQELHSLPPPPPPPPPLISTSQSSADKRPRDDDTDMDLTSDGPLLYKRPRLSSPSPAAPSTIT